MQRVVNFTNPRGLHLRPSAALAKLARQYNAKLEVISPKGRALASEMLQVLSLGISVGEVTLEAEGPQAAEVLEAAEQLLHSFHFEE